VLLCAAFVTSGLAVSYAADLATGPTIIVVAGSVYLLTIVAGRLVRFPVA
jgi:ABC-type Mn2+/Zn2+ transport system permease subunit